MCRAIVDITVALCHSTLDKITCDLNQFVYNYFTNYSSIIIDQLI